MNLIYHITEAAAWEHATRIGYYEAESLRTSGFIHLSKAEQVLKVANSFYKGQHNLVLLFVEPSRLQAELRYEPPAHPDGSTQNTASSELFPHVYGRLNLDAVVYAGALAPDAEGIFRALPVMP